MGTFEFTADHGALRSTVRVFTEQVFPDEVARIAEGAVVATVALAEERVLGLPREPEVDKNVPFRDVRKASATRSFS